MTALPAAFTVNTLDFELFPDDPAPYSARGICNLTSHRRFSRDPGRFFLEMPKFERLALSERPLSHVEQWMCFFIEDDLPRKKEEYDHGYKIMSAAMERTDRFFGIEEERRRYIDAEILRMDRESIARGWHEPGFQEGLGKGREEGREEFRKS